MELAVDARADGGVDRRTDLLEELVDLRTAVGRGRTDAALTFLLENELPIKAIRLGFIDPLLDGASPGGGTHTSDSE